MIHDGRSSQSSKLFAYGVLLVFLLLVPLVVKGTFYMHTFIVTMIFIIAASSLRTISLSGQISIAHAAFMGIGAYTSALLSKFLGWSPWVTILLGAFMAMGVAALVGYPFSRLRALYFSMLSLFFGMGIVALLGVFDRYTGGTAGLVGIPPLLGVSKVTYYYFFLALTIACLLVLYRFEHSRVGMTWTAIAESHMIASSVGINEIRLRVLSLTVGCFFAGLAGGSYAHYFTVMQIEKFSFLASMNLILYMLLGGMRSFAGPVIGTIILVIFPEFIRELKSFVPVIMGVIMMVVVFLMPDGIVGLIEQSRAWIKEYCRGKVGENGKLFT
jgi:branched-chain amino acid transport system permease protein